MNLKSIGDNESEMTASKQFRIEEISDDGEGNDGNDESKLEVMSFKEIITVLDKMRQYPVFDDESQDMLSTITRKIENLQLKN